MQGEVAKQLGTNVDSEDASMVSARKEFDEKKKALADAFSRKARALAEIEDLMGETFFFFFFPPNLLVSFEALVTTDRLVGWFID